MKVQDFWTWNTETENILIDFPTTMDFYFCDFYQDDLRIEIRMDVALNFYVGVYLVNKYIL